MKSNVNGGCKGIVFKASRSSYFTSGVYGERLTMKILKRKSGLGCSACGWMYENLSNLDHDDNRPPIITDDVIHGKLYRIYTINVSTDLETGYVDDYDLKFVEVME